MNKPMLGTWITTGNPFVAELVATQNFDWVCVDMEHSVTSYKDAQLIIMAIQSKGKLAYVRVEDNNPKIINKAIDAGADGIIIPMVSTVEEAQRAVNAIKYPPEGKRGVGLARAQGYGFNFENYKKGKAKEIKIIAIIEHIDAINNLKEIIEVQGLDGTFIGPYDLSGSLGKPGEYDKPDVKAAIAKYEKIAKEYKNKLMGFHVVPPDASLVQEKIKKGYNFIAFSLDTIFLGEMCKRELKKLGR